MITAVLLAVGVTASAADTDKPSPREAGRFVRVLYLAPADRDFRADFESSIAAAVASVHRWYREQLDGSTFAVYRPMAERCRLPENSDYYSRGDRLGKGLERCAVLRAGAARRQWRRHQCGTGRVGALRRCHGEAELRRAA